MTTRKHTKNARMEIIQAANRHITRGTHRQTFLNIAAPPTLLGSRNLQRCVCIVRRNRLVDDQTLVAAGFNPRGRR